MNLFTKRYLLLLSTFILILSTNFNLVFSQIVSRQEILEQIKTLEKSTNRNISSLSSQITQQNTALNEAISTLKASETLQQNNTLKMDDTKIIEKLDEINKSIIQLQILQTPKRISSPKTNEDEKKHDVASCNSYNINIGTDLVSRYVWRGTDFGDSPSIQPTLSFVSGGFEVGAWGAYQIGRDASTPAYNELDLFMGYSLDVSNLSLSFLLTDYYYPNSGLKFGNYNNWDNTNGAGAHVIELGVSVSGIDSFPLLFSAYINIYNDEDYSSYFELGYSTFLHEVSIDFFIGATPGGKNKYYGTDKFNVVNMGISASKEMKVSETFSLPIFASYIINPNSEIAHFVLGVSL